MEIAADTLLGDAPLLTSGEMAPTTVLDMLRAVLGDKLGDLLPIILEILPIDTDLAGMDAGFTLTVKLAASMTGEGFSMSALSDAEILEASDAGTAMETDGLPLAGLTDGENDHEDQRIGFLEAACASSAPV